MCILSIMSLGGMDSRNDTVYINSIILMGNSGSSLPAFLNALKL